MRKGAGLSPEKKALNAQDRQRAMLAWSLAGKLYRIQELDRQKDYAGRNRLIYWALALASMLDYPAGVRIDPLEPDWPAVFIELPTGQVSWHLPGYSKPWDGHTAREKNSRVDAFLGQIKRR